MRSKEICIVQDFQNNLWQFYISKDGAFIYRIMYSESKWTKEKRLDSNVEEFCIEIDNECNFHIMYVTSNGELKYCIYKDHQWSGKTLYTFDSSVFYIRELGLELLSKDINVVFILCKCGQAEKGKLMHYVWSGEEGVTSNIYTIELLPFTKTHYTIEVASESVLYLFFLTKDASEAAVMNCGYIDRTWSDPKKLYGITGKNIEIFTLEKDNEFNILNVSEENSSAVLERAFIDYKGTINSEIIYKTKEKVSEANFFIYNDTLWAQWLEGNNTIKYTYLEGKWKIPQKYDEEFSNIQIYSYKTLETHENTSNIKVVFGTAYPDLKLYVPKFFYEKETVENHEELMGIEELSTCNEEASFSTSKNRQEDSKFIRVLQKRVATLQMQLQLKERTIEAVIEKGNRINEQKRISEEKSEFFNKLQQQTKKELDNTLLLLKDERKMVNTLRSEVEYLNGILQTNKEEMTAYISDNEILKKEKDELTLQNKVLLEELSEERNKSIFARLLKKSD